MAMMAGIAKRYHGSACPNVESVSFLKPEAPYTPSSNVVESGKPVVYCSGVARICVYSTTFLQPDDNRCSTTIRLR